MKNAETLRDDVLDELAWEPSIDPASIGVAVKDGIVTLTGKVHTFAEKRAAEKAAKRVRGVEAIADEVEVHPPSALVRDDADIAKAAVAALKWNVTVPEDVMVTVTNGWVTLEGEARWQYQKRAAENALRQLTGVRGITNLITVKPSVRPADIKHRIEDAFRRNAQIDASHVNVVATGGKVVLRGTVRSWSEHRAAEDAAWAAPGVTGVENNVRVESMASVVA